MFLNCTESTTIPPIVGNQLSEALPSGHAMGTAEIAELQ